VKNAVEVLMIWAVVENESDAPWMVAAWDEYSIEGNHEGWEQEIAKAVKECGGENIRIIRTHIPYDTVQQAFMPVTVPSEGTAAVLIQGGDK
jgi:hypothetical protein